MTPENKAPDDLLPPQVQQDLPVAPAAQPISVLPPHLCAPQPVLPQVPQAVAPPPASPAIPVAQPVVPQQPVAPLPANAAIPVAQPVAPQQPVPQQPVPQQPIPQQRALPAQPPAAPPTAQPVVPHATKPTAKQPAPVSRATKPGARDATKAVAGREAKAEPTRRRTRKSSEPGTPAPSPAPRPVTPRPDTPPLVPAVTEADRPVQSVRDDGPKLPLAALFGGVPSWAVSSAVHVLLIVGLSLLSLTTSSSDETLFIEVTYAAEENLDDELLELPTLESMASEPLVLEKLPEVLDPLAAMPILDPNFLGEVAPAEFEAPALGIALSGREKGMRNGLVGQYGGTGATESSVEGGLAWLARHQQRDGSWSLQGPYPDGGPVENRAAATAMALLAFQGAGHTHRAGDYQRQVDRGWQALLKLQKDDGDFYEGDVPNQHLYTHGQATIAVCELYGMTKDEAFRQPAQRAVDFALDAQSPEGGWKYYPGRDSDTSVTGWFVMALQSALMAGLTVPEENLQRIGKYLDSVQLDGGSRYVYQPLQQANPTMTAEGLLCRQYLGWDRDDSRLTSGVEYVLSNPIDPQENHDVYYWYYAAQLTHHMEGDYWERWNNAMRVTIPGLQVTKGKDRGSWDPKPDRWSHLGGRLYTTCLSIYMLEVYYRHLPIYSYRS